MRTGLSDTKNRFLWYPTAVLFLILLCVPAMAQVDPNCQTEWCDAKFPPPAGTDRTIGKDNCGNVCIKIQKVVEVEKIIEKKVMGDKQEITVVLSQNEKGEPVLTASCPVTGMTKWDYKSLKSGFKQKLRTKKGQTFILYEK